MNELIEKALKDNDLLNNEEWKKIYYYALDNEIETLEDGTDYDTEFWFAIIFKHNDETYKFSYATDFAGYKDFDTCSLCQVIKKKIVVEKWVTLFKK